MKKFTLPLLCVMAMSASAATVIEPGVPYYMRSVATGQFLTSGAYYGTHACVGNSGVKVIFENTGKDDVLRPKSICGYFMANDIYLDKDLADASEWKVRPVNDGKAFVFSYELNGREVAVGLENELYINPIDIDVASPWQQWEVLTREDLIQELGEATIDNPKVATFLIPGAMIFNRSVDNEAWVRSNAGDAANFYLPSCSREDHWRGTLVYHSFNEVVEDAASTAYTITNTCDGLPDGSYLLSAYVASCGVQPVFTINGVEVGYDYCGDNAVLTADEFGDGMFAGKYKITTTVDVTDGTLVIKFEKGAGTAASDLYFQNFELTYLGADGSDPYVVLYANVKAAMEHTAGIAAELGLTNFDNATVQERWDSHTITGDGTDVVRECYENLAEAVKKHVAVPFDMTYAVVNPGFELGTWGWNFLSLGDSDVKRNSESNYATEGCDGEYLFNTWTDGGRGVTLGQTVTGLPKGTYTLSAKLSSPEGSAVYLVANGEKVSVNGIGSDKFQTAKVDVVLDGETPLEISVSGANENGGYVTEGGSWYRADSFALMRNSETAGIDSVIADDSDAPVQYYSILGMPVSNPSEGQLYIVKKGNSVTKVIY